MSINLERLDNKSAVIIEAPTTTGGAAKILVSYSTIVAARLPGRGYVKTDRFWSVTTSRHINQFLRGNPVETVPQSFLDGLLKIDPVAVGDIPQP